MREVRLLTCLCDLVLGCGQSALSSQLAMLTPTQCRLLIIPHRPVLDGKIGQTTKEGQKVVLLEGVSHRAIQAV